MAESCASCGARLYGDAAYCSQCFEPIARHAPGAVSASVPAASAASALDDDPMSYLSATLGAGGLLGDVQVKAPTADDAPGRPGSSLTGTLEGSRWLGGITVDASPPTAILTAVSPPSPPTPASVDPRAIRTAGAVIGLGVVFQVVTYLLGRAGTVEPSRAIQLSLYGTVTFYVVVAGVVLSQAQQVRFRPIWTEGDPNHSALVGLLAGLGVAVGLMSLSSVLSGTVQVDQRIAQIVSERSLARVLAAVLIAVIAAPLVEELLFRGLVVESMRTKGMGPAVMVGAVLFSAWHLNPKAFEYYLAMGVMLGTLYWKLGLKSSITAHAAFNGAITVVAVALAFGSHTISTASVSVTVPGSWHRVSTAQPGAAGLRADLVLGGPSGSGMFVVHQAIPPGVTFDLDRIAGSLAAGNTSVFGVERASVPHLVTLPAGPGIRMSIGYRGHQGDLVIVRTEASVWTVVLFSGGSGTALHDFDGIVRHLRLTDGMAGNP